MTIPLAVVCTYSSVEAAPSWRMDGVYEVYDHAEDLSWLRVFDRQFVRRVLRLRPADGTYYYSGLNYIIEFRLTFN